MGRERFVLVHGVLMWGLPMFVVMTFVLNREHQPLLIVLSALIWLGGGAVFGYWTWSASEKKHRKLLAEQADSARARLTEA